MALGVILSSIESYTACLLNLLLIPIILRFSSAYIGTYKYFLLAYTVANTCFAATYCLTLPTLFYSRNGFVLYGTRKFLDKTVDRLIIYLFAFSTTLIFLIICEAFVFRYAVNCRQKWFTKKPKMVITQLGTVLLLLYLAFSLSFCYPRNDMMEEVEMVAEVETTLNRSVKELAFLCGPTTSSISILRSPLIGISMIYSLAFIFLIIIIFCALKIHFRLRSIFETSTIHIKYQRQLFWLLILQLTFSQVIDPLIIGFGTRDYRTVIVRALRFKQSEGVTPLLQMKSWSRLFSIS